MTSRFLDKLEVFTRFLNDIDNLSTCKRLKTGCVVVAEDFSSVLAIGYNGPARGLPNDSCANSEGSCGCIHAEANAIIKLREPGIMLCTMSPCSHCAGLIINSQRIRAVIYSEPYRLRHGVDMLREAKIPIRHNGEWCAKLPERWPSS